MKLGFVFVNVVLIYKSAVAICKIPKGTSAEALPDPPSYMYIN